MTVNKECKEDSTKYLLAEIKRNMDVDWIDKTNQWKAITDPNEWVQDSLTQATSKANRFANGRHVPMRDEHVHILSTCFETYM